MNNNFRMEETSFEYGNRERERLAIVIIVRFLERGKREVRNLGWEGQKEREKIRGKGGTQKVLLLISGYLSV